MPDSTPAPGPPPRGRSPWRPTTSGLMVLVLMLAAGLAAVRYGMQAPAWRAGRERLRARAEARRAAPWREHQARWEHLRDDLERARADVERARVRVSGEGGQGPRAPGATMDAELAALDRAVAAMKAFQAGR